MIESAPWLTIAPPIVAIVLAILTRRVMISLGAGVVAAALLVAGFNPLETLRLIWESFITLFWSDGALDTWYIYILLFIVLNLSYPNAHGLGLMT